VGWHPLCRCTATPILPTDEEEIMDYIMGDAVDFKYVQNVPDGFNKWVNANAGKIENWKTQPFWVRDNFKGGRIENGLGLPDIKVPKAGAPEVTIPVKSIREVEERMRKIGFNNIELGNIDIDTANVLIRTLESENKLSKLEIGVFKFSPLKENIGGFYLHDTNPTRRILHINSSIKKTTTTTITDSNEIIKRLNERIESKNSFIKQFKEKLNGNKTNDLKWKKMIRAEEVELSSLEFQIIEYNKYIESGLYKLPNVYYEKFAENAKRQEAILRHEIGHHRDHVNNFTSYYQQKFQTNEKYLPSKYANSLDSEYFAEMYTKWRMEGDSEIPEDILKLFKSL
jgi:hypothetical protein